MKPLGTLVLVTATTAEPLTRPEVKDWLKIEPEEVLEDSLIDGLMRTAVKRYETHTRRALIKQTYDEYYDEPFGCEIALQRSPVVSVTHIKGFSDTDATDTGGSVMNSSEYYVDTISQPSRIVPFGGFTFPTATRVANAAVVRYIAGYSTGSSGIPDVAKQTLKNMIARAYEFRGDQTKADQAMDEALTDELSLPEWG